MFNANREISFTEYAIQKGKRYRIAISNSLYNPFELVEFVAPSSSPLTIKIKRYYNFSTTEKVVLGYAFVSKD